MVSFQINMLFFFWSSLSNAVWCKWYEWLHEMKHAKETLKLLDISEGGISAIPCILAGPGFILSLMNRWSLNMKSSDKISRDPSYSSSVLPNVMVLLWMPMTPEQWLLDLYTFDRHLQEFLGQWHPHESISVQLCIKGCQHGKHIVLMDGSRAIVSIQFWKHLGSSKSVCNFFRCEGFVRLTDYCFMKILRAQAYMYDTIFFPWVG